VRTLTEITLNNSLGCRNVWIHLIDSTNRERCEKYAADGMLKTWDPSLQKSYINRADGRYNACTPRTIGIAKDSLILPDVLSVRDYVTCKPKIISNSPLASGEEDKLKSFSNNYESHISANEDEKSRRNDKKQNVPHQYIKLEDTVCS
jgi:hypothetical protein